MAVDHRDQRGISSSGARSSSTAARSSRGSVVPGPLRRLPAGVEPVGRGDREQAGVANVLEDLVVHGERLGRNDALVYDGDSAPAQAGHRQ